MAAANSIVQYVVVRRDLASVLKWPTGALIAQACHACTAVIHQNYKDDVTQEYLSDLDRMHKIILEAKDADALDLLAENLIKNNIIHKLWIEQPENIPTCLAVKPYRKNDISSHFKAFKLFK
ncbi:peptidyl-tRNA hydrolase PTRHD1 [Biomphalaria pfeifferi]|uniref:peptidyl-tRNA hydrolase n=1 Tax=Biomphalaria pfeifferi TaxID=112525 RepID=A0AAD8FKB2_BIOPF|nr:peptidyl-tRNA hydrolase PTRHD1 [Biomphalaria pfeifferi]